MKLTPILSQYYFAHHNLTLAGIGTFSANTKDPAGPASFVQDPHAASDESLINYIAEQTGKMKPLAASDLDSFLELAIQFLHMGKPFQLEGIGTLVKNNAGNFTFIPEGHSTDPEKELMAKELEGTSLNEEAFGPYESSRIQPKSDGLKKAIFFILLIGGIFLAIWGGYWIYKNSQAAAPNANDQELTDVVPVLDTAPVVYDPAVDSSRTIASPDIKPAENNQGYQFILEVGNKERIDKRYTQLKSYFWDVYMQAIDSANYKIYMQLPVSATDTTAVKDSLSLLTGRRVSIAHE